MITLVFGGSRSGKSAVAEKLAERSGPHVTYIATGPAHDQSMTDRIEAHRARRPTTWATVECGPGLVDALRSTTGTVLVDALGTWVSAHHDFAIDLPALLAALTDHTGDVIIVSDEVGLGVHPSTALGGKFRDVIGTVNHAVADIADQVLFVIAGRVLPLGRP